jgi:hypothetical protein
MIRELHISISCVMCGRIEFMGHMYGLWLILEGVAKCRKIVEVIICMLLEIVLDHLTQKGQICINGHGRSYLRRLPYI